MARCYLCIGGCRVLDLGSATVMDGETARLVDKVASNVERLAELVEKHDDRLSALESARGQAGEGEAHPEDTCQRCGGPNIVWYADSDLWNKYTRREGILCPICFAKEAEAGGLKVCGWRLAPGDLSDEFATMLNRNRELVDRIAELEAERDAAVRERDAHAKQLDAWADAIATEFGCCDDAPFQPSDVAKLANAIRKEAEIQSARLRDAAVRVAAAAKSYDSNREVYPAFMQRVRDLCALVGEEAKTNG